MQKVNRPLILAGVSFIFFAIVLSGLVFSEAADATDTKRNSKRQRTDRLATPAATSPAAAFDPDNLVIYRVGDGVDALGSTATAVFLDEYTQSGTLVQSIPLPTSQSGSNRRLTASGTSTSEGFLTRSTNGRYLVFAGYDAALTTAGVTSSTSAAVNRVIGRVDQSGTVDTTTALTDAISGGNPRGVVSTNGTDLWLSGTSSGGGIRYATFGATTSTSLGGTPTNLRAAAIAGGQIYVTSSSGTTRLATVGTGTPTTAGQTITSLPGSPTTGSPYGIFFADLNPFVPGVDTLYFADDGAVSGGVFKYSLVSGTWVANGSVTLPVSRGLAGMINGSTVALYVTTGSSLQVISDNSGYNATMTGTPLQLAAATANTAFRGIALAPLRPKAAVDMNGDGRTDYTVARPIGLAGAGAAESLASRSRLRMSARERMSARKAGGESSFQPSGGLPIAWFTEYNGGGGGQAVDWGDYNTDDPLVTDFDGDGRDDVTVWRKPDQVGDQAYYYSLTSDDFTFIEIPFGTRNDFPSIVGDYDADGVDDPAVFRCPTIDEGQCYFYYLGSKNNPSGNVHVVPFGIGSFDTFLPFRGDFNGDGKNDFAVQTFAPWDPDKAIFYLWMNDTTEFEGVQWGLYNDRIIPGDFDGDGRSDLTVTRKVAGQLWWYVLERDGGTQYVAWGNTLDVEVPGDYDGDGKDDFAIYRDNEADATFWVQPASGAPHFKFDWGLPNDIPLANVFTQ